MKKVTISLNRIEDLKMFCNSAVKSPFEVTVKQGKYIVDGKSLMGMFSLDLASEVEIEIDDELHEDSVQRFLDEISAFVK